MAATIQLVLVDDHAMLREGLRSKFSTHADISIVGEAASLAELRETLRRTPADVVILDLSLPDGNGLEALPELKRDHPALKVIVLTMYDHERYAIRALENGADGYVVKGSAFEELERAVHDAVAGKPYVSSSLGPRLAGWICSGSEISPLERLSDREFEVLTMIGRGCPLKEIAQSLHIGEKSVSTYRARLMEKLRLQTNADLIRFAMENGLMQ